MENDTRNSNIATQKAKPKLIHETDLFHPHGDPDDHFDLATVFALAYSGELDIENIIIDYPPPHRAGDPALLAVSQLRYITGIDVPVNIGTPVRMEHRKDTQPNIESRHHSAVNKIISILKDAEQPVYISIVGASHDIAIAANIEPQLFKEKCAGVFLNSGSGVQYSNEESALEYNVKLNAGAYAAIFDLPCPVYWLPCFHIVYPNYDERAGEFGTVYRFAQKEIFDSLSSYIKNYFIYMLEQSADPKWLRYLENEPKAELVEKYGEMYRRMWSTASFYQIAGKTVNENGEIVPIEGMLEAPIYTFEPIKISCSNAGITSWEFDAKATDRFIFRVKNLEKYNTAMTKALASILSKLP